MSPALKAATKIKRKSASCSVKFIYVGKWNAGDRKLLQRAMDDGFASETTKIGQF